MKQELNNTATQISPKALEALANILHVRTGLKAGTPGKKQPGAAVWPADTPSRVDSGFSFQDGLRKRMFGVSLCNCGDLHKLSLRDPTDGLNLGDARFSDGERARLVEDDRIDPAQTFDVYTTLDDRAVPCGSPNSTQNS